MLTNKPQLLNLLGLFVIFHMLVSWILEQFGTKEGISICCVSVVNKVLLCLWKREQSEGSGTNSQGRIRSDLARTCDRKLNDLPFVHHRKILLNKELFIANS